MGMGLRLRFEQDSHWDDGICALGHWDLVGIWARKWEQGGPFRTLHKSSKNKIFTICNVLQYRTHFRACHTRCNFSCNLQRKSTPERCELGEQCLHYILILPMYSSHINQFQCTYTSPLKIFIIFLSFQLSSNCLQFSRLKVAMQKTRNKNTPVFLWSSKLLVFNFDL